MAYKPVKSIAEWQQALNNVLSRVVAMKGIVHQLQRAEATAGRPGAIDWPIDDLAAELMYNRADEAGPFKEYDDEIDAALAPSFRYQYTVKPGRPVQYMVGRLTFVEGRICVVAIGHPAEECAGGPFSSVFSGVTGDKVQLSWTSPAGEVATYDNLRVDLILGAGMGVGFAFDDMIHVRNPYFIKPWVNTCDYWSLGDGWSWVGNTVTTGGVPTDTNVVQTNENLVWPFVNGVTYIADIDISVYNSGTLTPKIGGASGGGITGAGQWTRCITCTESGADFILDADAFDGTIDSVHIYPTAWEHIRNPDFIVDRGWAYSGNWWYDAANARMADNGAPIAKVDTLRQFQGNMAVPLVPGTTYRVDIEIASTAGSIRPILGDAVGYYLSAPVNLIHTQYLTPTTTHINLDLESAGDWQGHISYIGLFEEIPNPDGPMVVKLQQTDE